MTTSTFCLTTRCWLPPLKSCVCSHAQQDPFRSAIRGLGTFQIPCFQISFQSDSNLLYSTTRRPPGQERQWTFRRTARRFTFLLFSCAHYKRVHRFTSFTRTKRTTFLATKCQITFPLRSGSPPLSAHHSRRCFTHYTNRRVAAFAFIQIDSSKSLPLF